MGMSNKCRHQDWLLKALAVAILATATPSVSQAQNAEARGLWMATSASESTLSGRGFGRLAVDDGALAFQSAGFEWRLPLSGIKRVAASKQAPNALEIESESGMVYYVGILDSKLMMASPGKALRMIQRAVETAPAPAPARATLAAAAGGSGGVR